MSYEEETLFSTYLVAAREEKGELSSSNFGTRIGTPDACFLEQFADGGFLERLIAFKAAAGRGPVAPPCKGISLVDEAEQKNSTVRIKDEQAGGWATAHGPTYPSD